MVRHKSVMKRARQSERRRIVRRSKLRKLRTQLRKIRLAISENNADEVQRLVSPTLSLIDRSTHGGILHRNNAARQKSRLMSQINTLSSVPPSA